MTLHLDAHDNEVRDEIRKLKRDVTRLFDALGDDARHRVRDLSKLAKAHTHTAQGLVEDKLRDRPLAALGVVAGVSLVLGMYLAARR